MARGWAVARQAEIDARPLWACAQCGLQRRPTAHVSINRFCSMRCRGLAQRKPGNHCADCGKGIQRAARRCQRCNLQAVRAAIKPAVKPPRLCKCGRAIEPKKKSCASCKAMRAALAVRSVCVRCSVGVNQRNRTYCDQCWSEVNNAMRGKKKDSNHQPIAQAFEDAGAICLDLSDKGGGYPDLLVCFQERMFFVEVKNPKTSYGRRGLNKHQVKFRERYNILPYFVVKTADEAQSILRFVSRPEQLDQLKAEITR